MPDNNKSGVVETSNPDMEGSRSEILKPLPSDVPSTPHHADPFLYVERLSKQLQQDLQTYLDAQSAGLSAGLAASSTDDSTSNGSLTPTASQRNDRKSSVTVPVRQPRERKLGLRGARRGILRSMHKLLSLKEEEQRTIDSELADRTSALTDVSNFANKRDGLQDTIDKIQRDDSAARVEDLTKESKTLEEEMHVLEMKLMEMRARHRGMLNEISQLQNSVDSKLSSYKESLSLLDSDAQRYLKSPPIKPLPLADKSSQNFYALNPKRRTLEMAKEHWTVEREELRKRRQRVDLDIDALKEGGGVWNKAVGAVSEFEKMLAEEMHQSTMLSPPGPAGLQQSRVDKARSDAIFTKIDETITQLEDLLRLAEQRNWNLLICSIGAELEAFRQAKPRLSNIFPPDEGSEPRDRSPSDDNDDIPPEYLTGPTNRSPSPASDTKAEEKPSESGYPSGTRTAGRVSRRIAEDDDEPDPAWLLP